MNYLKIIFKYLGKSIKIFEPNEIINLIWDIIIIIFLSLDSIYIPLSFCFNLSHKFLDNFEKLSGIIFSFEVLLNFNTSYYSKGEIISDRYKIAKNYLKVNFFLDFITTFPLLISLIYDLKILQLFFIIRIIKMRKIMKKLESYLELINTSKAIYDLINLFFIVFYIAHICSCIWNYLAIIEISYGFSQTWIHYLKIQDLPWFDKYISGLYFSFVTMTTVGYGDIIPQTTVEKSYCTIFMFVACGVFAFSINSIGAIIENISKSEEELTFFYKK